MTDTLGSHHGSYDGIGAEPRHGDNEDTKQGQFTGGMRAADSGRTHDTNAVGGNAKASTEPIPSLPNWQDQAPGSHRETRATDEYSKPGTSGSADSDWDDVTGH